MPLAIDAVTVRILERITVLHARNSLKKIALAANKPS